MTGLLICGKSIWECYQPEFFGSSVRHYIGLDCAAFRGGTKSVNKSRLVRWCTRSLKGGSVTDAADHYKAHFSGNYFVLIRGLQNIRHKWPDSRLLYPWVSRKEHIPREIALPMAIGVAPLVLASAGSTQGVIFVDGNYVLPRKNIKCYCWPDIFQRVFYDHCCDGAFPPRDIKSQWLNYAMRYFHPRSLVQNQSALSDVICSLRGGCGCISRCSLLSSSYGEIVSISSLLSQLRKLLLIEEDHFIGLRAGALNLFELPFHNVKLAVVNIQSAEANQSQSDLAPQSGVVNPVNVFRKSCGICWLLIGVIMAALSQYVLLYQGWDWLRWRRVFGIPGWGVAAWFIWHGAGLLWGIN